MQPEIPKVSLGAPQSRWNEVPELGSFRITADIITSNCPQKRLEFGFPSSPPLYKQL